MPHTSVLSAGRTLRCPRLNPKTQREPRNSPKALSCLSTHRLPWLQGTPPCPVLLPGQSCTPGHKLSLVWAQPWGHGGPAWCSTPAAGWFSQAIPALPPTPGRFTHLDFSTEELTPRLLLGTKPWVSCRGKYSFFSSLPFSKVFCRHIPFHHWGNADSPALFFSPFTKFKPMKSSANMLFSMIFSLPKAQSLPQKLLQLTGLQVSLQPRGM